MNSLQIQLIYKVHHVCKMFFLNRIKRKLKTGDQEEIVNSFELKFLSQFVDTIYSTKSIGGCVRVGRTCILFKGIYNYLEMYLKSKFLLQPYILYFNGYWRLIYYYAPL